MSKNKILSYFFNFILVILVLYFSLGVRDTADLEMYEFFYYNDWDKVDPMFIWLTKMGNYLGWDYFAFYQFHIILYTFSYFFIITRYSRNYFYIFFLFILMYYVPYINQIRFYLAFPFYLISIYYIINHRKLILFFVFTFLAVTTHSAVILLYGFLPMYYFLSEKHFFKLSFILSGVFFVIMFLLFQMNILQQIAHFGEYFSKGFVSSISGGVFNAIPYFIYIVFIYYWDNWYRKNYPESIQEKLYIFLRKLSFFTIIFIPSSILAQVIGHRYVFPFLIIWMVFFLFIIKNQPPRKKVQSLFLSFFVHLIVAFTFYDLQDIVLGESHYEQELLRSLKSVKYLYFLF